MKIFENSNLIKEVVDHTAKIIDISFNPRLNIFATSSYDGSICIYFLPCKLVSIIKHPEKKFYDKVFISANPFPTIITFEKENDLLRSYSISGLLIKEKIIEIEKKNKSKDKGLYNINQLFDLYGGNFEDKIIIFNEEGIIEYSLPFFEGKSFSFF